MARGLCVKSALRIFCLRRAECLPAARCGRKIARRKRIGMHETDAELCAALGQLGKTANQVVAASKQLVKALDKFSSPESLNRQDYLADALRALRGTDLAPYGGAQQYAPLERAVEARLRALRLTARQDFLTGIRAGAPNPDRIKMISDSPLVLHIHPLTLEADFDQCKTTLSYAREPLAQSSLDAEEIFKTYGELLDQFRASRIDSRAFWHVLKTAYDIVLLKDKKSPGDRADIVDMLTPLLWLWPDAAPFKKLTALPRYLLAYQIQKLRQDGLISRDGFRLDLGTATGGSTKNKANVLFIPMGATEGQYYLSMCFRRE